MGTTASVFVHVEPGDVRRQAQPAKDVSGMCRDGEIFMVGLEGDCETKSLTTTVFSNFSQSRSGFKFFVLL